MWLIHLYLIKKINLYFRVFLKMDMNLAFEFKDQIWWRADYIDIKNDDLKNQIKEMGKTISYYREDNDLDNYFKGFSHVYILEYVLECLDAERNIEIDRKSHLDNLKYFEQILSKENVDLTKNDKKVKNFYSTITEVFPDIFFPKMVPHNFSIELAIDLHKKIGNEVIEKAGEFRNKEAKPANESNRYLAAKDIEETLTKLFEKTKTELFLNSGKLEHLIKLGAQFLTRFLQIHPFSNGNGRVARLLLSYLLSSVSVVPVSLYTQQKEREIYLDCLRESRLPSGVFLPDALATYILECVHLSISKILKYLDFNLCASS